MKDFNGYSRLIVFFLISLLTVVLIRTAWVCDDAYITMRAVDNFVNGYGPVYNVGERVQSFTHPLWMFLVSGVYMITHEAYYTLIFMSMILTLIVAIFLTKRVAQTQAAAILGMTIILFSKSFIDFSTSGLENPLTHLILIVFALLYLTMISSLKKLLILSFIAALGALNRLDLLLIFLPAVIFVFLELWISTKNQHKRQLLICFTGFSPLILWLVFAVFYYGFFFPNPAYAKLNTGLPEILLMRQGADYFLSLLALDPFTLLVIISALAVAILSRNAQKGMLAVGIGLYLGYIVYIGGDFMNGRFFTAPFLFAVILLCRSEMVVDWKSLVVPLGFVLIIGFTSPYPPLLSNENYPYGIDPDSTIDIRGVADERAYYYQTTGLLKSCRKCEMPNHQWVKDGLAMKKSDNHGAILGNIGFYGYYAGPKKYISDTFALVDPLLARLPVPDVKEWRIGHYQRSVPLGYAETLDSGVIQFHDPGLGGFYRHLALITRGDLFDPQRLVAILEMNLGEYNYLLPPADSSLEK